MTKLTGIKAALLLAALAVPQVAAEAEEPKRGGTLNILVHPEPSTLMYGLSQRGETQVVGGKIYDGLLSYDFDLTPKPRLAESWEISPDGLSYTFRLREGVKWHDGTPLTAEDVVFTTTEFLPKTSPRARSTFGNVKSVSAVDELTVQFEMKKSFPAFLTALNISSVPIVPAHIYRGSDFESNPMNDTPIGTGPFKLKEWKRGEYIHLVRNEDYWELGKPYLDEVYVRIIPDVAARANAFETGVVDAVRAPYVEYVDLKRLSGLPNTEEAIKGNELNLPIAWVMFNLRKPPFNDKRFRQAVYHAIDRKFIRDTIWFTYATIATGPIATSSPFYEADVKQYDYDLEKAKALLDDMGLAPGPKGIRASFEIMPPDIPTFSRMAEYIRQQLAQIGLEAKIVKVDQGTWSKRLGQFDFEISLNWLSQLGDPAIGVSRNYHSQNVVQGSPFGNNGGYENKEVDALFDQAAAEVDFEKRKQLYSQIQKILVEDVPVAWLVENPLPAVYHSKVRNLVRSTYQYSDSFADVYLAE